ILGEPAGVYADLRRLNPVIAGEDAGFIVLDYPGGQRGLFDGNRLSDHQAEDRRRSMGEMWIEGEHATLRIDGEGRLWLRDFGSNIEKQHAFEWSNRHFGGDCVYLSCKQYLNAFMSGEEHPTEARRYLQNLRIEEAVYASAEAGARVSL
ncbi:MAG: gfo/Idh/MocA family oxidoreductase, partial [Pseudomonadota bacterium]